MLSSCISLQHFSSSLTAQQLEAQSGWQAHTLASKDFDLLVLAPKMTAVHDDCRGTQCLLTVYIEGDGRAWLSRHRPSIDPTPKTALAFELAQQHTIGPAAYLARPCQYLGGLSARNCRIADWTHARFSQKVIDNVSAAIGALKTRMRATHLILAGYSGGGTLAALVAAERDDVVGLITIAGVLDTQKWTTLHAVSPLKGSRNPLDVAGQLAPIPQWHFLGGEDDVVPQSVLEDYQAAMSGAEAFYVEYVPGFDHACCWPETWSHLLELIQQAYEGFNDSESAG